MDPASYIWVKNGQWAGPSCGTDGRAVTFDTRDPRFESSHHQFTFTYCQMYYENEEKEAVEVFRLVKEQLRTLMETLMGPIPYTFEYV